MNSISHTDHSEHTKKRAREEEEIAVHTAHDRPTKQQKKKKILVYYDLGTNEQSTGAIITQLKQGYPQMKIETVSAETLRKTAWEDQCAALVMGGGVCSIWEHSLKEKGMRRIRNFVQNGGKYLGICAGAYFAASTSVFSLLEQPVIEKRRPLQFYPGIASGPIFPTFDHLSPQAALAARIDLVAQSGLCYYQGGCYFNITEDSWNTKVIGKYASPFDGAAIISCKVGSGTAVLCGPHPEFAWTHQMIQDLTQVELSPLAQSLSLQEDFRKQIWNAMLKELF